MIKFRKSMGKVHDKKSQQIRNRENLLNLIKITFKKPTTTSYWWWLAFPLWLGTRKEYPFSQLSFNIEIISLVNLVRQGKEIKVYRVGKKKWTCMSLFADDIIIENNKESATTKLLQLISDYSKAAEYRSKYKKKSITFLYTRNGQLGN